MPLEKITSGQNALSSFAIIAAAITVVRMVLIILSPAALGPDEAQYWFWSREPAFGYFSKPPSIAWVIFASTSLFGDNEWAVRLPAPLLHFGGGLFIFLTARALYDARTAFWAGLGWITLPGVVLSSFLMTTDALLLFFWSGALYFLTRLYVSGSFKTIDYLGLGAMVGLGFLSKYAMLYFFFAVLAGCLIDQRMRKIASRRGALAAAGVAAILIAPNILWNAHNDFQTVAHTAANANWGASLFKPDKLLIFLGGQLAVAGVIPFTVFLFAAYQNLKPKAGHAGAERRARYLIFFALTPLIIVSAQAFISRAHANWAAAAYPAVIILATAFLVAQSKAWLAKFSIAVHLIFMAGFTAVMVALNGVSGHFLANTTKDIRGWESQSRQIAAMADGFDAIMIDDRPLLGEMFFYMRDAGLEIVALDPNARIDNHFEAFKAFDPAKHKRVLFVTTRDDAAHVDYRFSEIQSLGKSTVAFHENVSRTYHLFDVSGYFGPGAP